MANKVQFNCRVSPKNSAEFVKVMNVIQPTEEMRRSKQHQERVARARKSFSNLAFRIK
ncbi:hypothetical protein [Liquorilactobacillus mali]|uniref:hypothetical protein n=1 Tax=Liquorilactobacillus mali TaxID=1618 RepID=UPI002350D584|nr:hypothetical protein [Liquorilactobacillus mali]MDC7954198.1 hypothetical protein [Liquorilactobacillus mali]